MRRSLASISRFEPPLACFLPLLMAPLLTDSPRLADPRHSWGLPILTQQTTTGPVKPHRQELVCDRTCHLAKKVTQVEVPQQ